MAAGGAAIGLLLRLFSVLVVAEVREALTYTTARALIAAACRGGARWVSGEGKGREGKLWSRTSSTPACGSHRPRLCRSMVVAESCIHTCVQKILLWCREHGKWEGLVLIPVWRRTTPPSAESTSSTLRRGTIWRSLVLSSTWTPAFVQLGVLPTVCSTTCASCRPPLHKN